MNPPISTEASAPAEPRRRMLFAAGLAGAVMLAWLVNTPTGLLGKADAVGYAVCHRIDLRSFHLGERSLPLCSRCTGLYLGALASVFALALTGRGRVGGFPSRRVVPFLGAALLAFAVDGVNSYMHFFAEAPHLYEPTNVGRLVAGTALGLAIGALVLAGFNQNSWRDWIPAPVLSGPRDLALLAGAGALVVVLVLSENPLILYPLALLSSLSVLMLLTAVYSVLATLTLKIENRARRSADLVLPLAIGLTLAIAHIGSFNLVRYAIFGTWSGFSL